MRNPALRLNIPASLQCEAPTWETELLSLARSVAASPPTSAAAVPGSETQLAAAYRYCEAVVAQHSRSFYLASSFLPPSQRLACRALYAFCRISDDIVDQPLAEPQRALAEWRLMALGPQHARSAHHPVVMAFQDARKRYQIPEGYAHQLLDGLSIDLQAAHYETFAELSRYCYGAASTVGLMSMRIVGFANQDAVLFAVKLGIALQMTNILRDIGEDLRIGRVYLPQEELSHFGINLAELGQGHAGPELQQRWCEFMRFQIARTRQLYTEAKPGLRLLDRSGRFAIIAAAELYSAILNEIERRSYDVFTQRARVGTAKKIRRLARVWLAHQTN